MTTSQLAARAAGVAAAVAGRVADPDRVAEAVSVAAGQAAHPGSVHWRDHAVGQGHAGLALLFGALDRRLPGEGWDRTAHRHLALAAGAAEALPDAPAGLFAGLAGVGLVATCLSGDGSRYRGLLATIDRALAARVPALVARAGRSGAGAGRADPPAGPDRSGGPGAPAGSDRSGGCAARELDLISGLAGVGAYLLLRRAEPVVAPALRLVLEGLVHLTGPDALGPRWRTPPAALSPAERTRHPNGHLNCGLAHGVPGPLGVLSLALRDGFEVRGLQPAVARTADWLATHRSDDPAGPNWPNAFPLPDHRPDAPGHGSPGADAPPGHRTDAHGQPATHPPARSAWCYGAPGVAAALRLAGEAVGHAGYQHLAASALSAALTRSDRGRGIGSSTFCHGQAGVLAITATFARATGDPGFSQATAAMTGELLDRFDPATPLGYHDQEAGGRTIDQPGLLTGAPGVALTLLGATSPTQPSWDRLFLLA